MSPVTTTARRSHVLSETTLVPLGFLFVILTALGGLAKWVGAVEARQESDRQVAMMLVGQLEKLTIATIRASEDAAATRAQVHMILRELDQRK